MRHASIPVPGSSASDLMLSRAVPRRGGFFALILDALHRSRRLQAERILRHYRHLVARTDQPTACNPPSNPETRDHVGH
jgi:hypothetical protein